MFPKEFEDYLKTNYNEPEDRQVFVDVGNFFLQYPFPEEIDEHLNILRIKFLTKIASHGVDAEFEMLSGIRYSSDLIESAIRYCNSGIERIVAGRTECDGTELLSEDIVKMHGHLYCHMAKFEHILARNLQDDNEKKKILLAARNHVAEGIRISEGVEKEHPAYQFKFKADIEVDLAKCCSGKEKYSFALEAAQSILEGGRRTEKFNPLHSAYQYTFAADHFYNASLIAPIIEEKNKALLNAFEFGRKGAEMIREQEPKHWAITCGNIGKFAEALFYSTGDCNWKRMAINYYSAVRDYFSSINDCLHVRDAMYAKILALTQNSFESRSDKKHRLETRFIKQGNERNNVRKHIEDELQEFGY